MNNDYPLGTFIAMLLLGALICAGDYGCSRVFCSDPTWMGVKLGWTCLGSPK